MSELETLLAWVRKLTEDNDGWLYSLILFKDGSGCVQDATEEPINKTEFDTIAEALELARQALGEQTPPDTLESVHG